MHGRRPDFAGGGFEPLHHPLRLRQIGLQQGIAAANTTPFYLEAAAEGEDRLGLIRTSNLPCATRMT
jgi:hypothetical protein